MQPTAYQIEEQPGRYAVRVDGCWQPNDPDQPGDVAMDRARAVAVAKVLAGRLGYDLADIGEPAEVVA